MFDDVQEKRDWRIYFPVYGLEITDETSDLSSFMFGDATIVASKHVPELLRVMPTLQQPYVVTEAHTFPTLIVVRRKGIISRRAYQPLVEDARERAYKLAALLSLIFFAENNTPHTCALVEQVHAGTAGGVAWDAKEGWCVSMGQGAWGQTLAGGANPIRVSWQQLEDISHKEEYDGLTRVLALPGKPVDDTHIDAIARCALQLAEAMHSITPSAQLLGAVTALEILLAKRDKKEDIYGSVQRRLEALVGVEAVTRYGAKGIFEARHDYVHEGEKLELRLIPIRAFGLTLSALLRYAQAAPRFPYKEAFMDYLDWIAQSDRLRNFWTEAERNAYDAMLRHTREGFYFSWQVASLSLDFPLNRKQPR